MRKAKYRRGSNPPTSAERASDRAGGIATVASLGVQARLVRVDPLRECEVAALISSYERLCVEWDRLLQRAVDLLGEDLRIDRTGDSSSHSTCD